MKKFLFKKTQQALTFAFFLIILSGGTHVSQVNAAYFGVTGNSIGTNCVDGSWNMGSSASNCLTNADGNSTGIYGVGAGQEFPDNGKGTYPIGKWRQYAPFSGAYKMRLHLCYGIGHSRCTLARSSDYRDSRNSVKLNSRAMIYEQTPDFGGLIGATTSQAAMLCMTLVDTHNVEWSSSDATSCQDAGRLPDTPATCYLNGNADLNVDMGTLERSSIATVPASGGPNNIKKTLPVLCTRDAGTTVLTTIQFTPITVSGSEVVSTSISNLGVAIFYDGKLIGPSSSPLTETFQVGYTDREFEFQAVRTSGVAIKDIPTGAFTASAVMIMTEQ